MKVEHLTLGGNSVVRNTNIIENKTKEFFNSIEYKSGVVRLPGLSFDIDIIATGVGVVFNLKKGDEVVVSNYCGFDGELRPFKFVEMYANEYSHICPPYKGYKKPKEENWIYSILINPFVFTIEELMIAGEIELYIFERLYESYVSMQSLKAS